MNRARHHATGAAAGLGLAAAFGWSPWQALASTVIAGTVGAMPDLDQLAWWRLADRALPDEALGRGGPMRHRGLTHWWLLPAAAGAWLWVEHPGWWFAWAFLAGWSSHLAGDFVFGQASANRGPGIPLLPWRGHVGVGLKSGGAVERVTVAGLILPSCAWMTLAILHLTEPIIRSADAVLRATGH